MGGIGSGEYPRFGTKQLTDEFIVLDIRKLPKTRFIDSESLTTLRFNFANNYSYILNCKVSYDSVISLNPINQVIWKSYTSCNYGGERAWLNCPECQRRVAVLYGCKQFKCRHCRRLAYRSQNEHPLYSMVIKSLHIRRLLSDTSKTNTHIRRPKYMHTKTFDAYLDFLDLVELELDNLMFNLNR